MSGFPIALWLSAASALVGSILFGYHLGVLNTCQSHVEADLRVTHEGGGAALVAGLLVGATAGSLLAGRMADHFGPRTASVLNTSALLAGAVLCAGAAGFWAMLLGRLVAGLGSGAASVLVPRYLAELAPVPIRGALGTLTQVFVNVGILCSLVVGLPYESGAETVTLLGREVAWWRVMFGAAAGPALLQAAALALCPESPIWMLHAGQAERAAATLRRLHGARFRPQDYPKLQPEEGSGEQPLMAGEHGGGGSGGEEAAAHGDSPPLGWAALWHPRYRRVMVLASAIPLLQQLSGINTVVFFSTDVLQQAGLTSPILGSIAVGGTNLAFTVVAAFLMESAGRRPLLLTSFAGMGACLAALSASLLLPLARSAAGLASLACILAYMAFFAIGAGPLPFLLLPELLPQEIMGTAQGFCTSLNWASNILIGASFPLMLSALGIAGSYLVYAALCAASAAFFAQRMVETKQQPVERIRALLVDEGA